MNIYIYTCSHKHMHNTSEEKKFSLFLQNLGFRSFSICSESICVLGLKGFENHFYIKQVFIRKQCIEWKSMLYLLSLIDVLRGFFITSF